MSDETVTEQGGLTRREMLKKAVITGGVVAWSGPVIRSFNAPAYAQTAVSPASCTSWDCDEPWDICGTSGPINRCLCDVDVEGNAFCWEDQFCSSEGVVPCRTSADCPPGWRCVTNCCGTVCFPECGTNANTTVAATAAVESGGTGAGQPR